MTDRKAVLPAARGLLAVALLLTAGVMWSWLPTKLQSWAPIDVHGTVGQRVVGRNIVVTVHRAYLAHEVAAKGANGLNRLPSKGVWLVMLLTYEPATTPQSPRFDLLADGNTFNTNLSGFHSVVQPDMPESGPLTFELPKAPKNATLLVSNALSESSMATMDFRPLDSRIAVDVPLAGVVPAVSLNLDELADQ
ncbi:hypothetical protein A5658_15910 [Mycobacterium sp. 1245111.1]|uniref:hypothetical protein n=1 Tax=Mycobacterium sp. 1245111.1 TaxID=1834073 RepID=UPI0007FC1FB6|nr:hypothetical protein [Mycobacterium sp. 1245111.1]OBK32522.1 hypothetical protein A5658_15910 [Mycobacterium sp. 1245111.1]